MATREIITVGTKSTMPTSRAEKPGTNWLIRFWPEATRIVVGLALGFALLWLAIPRTMAAFVSLPGDPVLQAIQTGKTVTNDDLSGFIASRNNALKWVDAGRTWTDLGLGHLHLAEQAGGDTATATSYREKSARALKTGLSMAPANSYAWARMSYLDLRLGRARAHVRDSLILSLFTGPYERPLAESRIQYALAIWHEFNVRQQALVNEQIVFLDRFERRGLLKIISQDRNYRVIALTALARHPERQAALRAALKK
jgi:hypothetical protein